MNSQFSAGVFGKLPAHGDFIYRDLPTRFINVLDTWLQGFVGGSQEQLGEQWLDIYLTSPIWRFAFSEGVVDESAWVGLFLPSVDRVGRYFPFSVAMPLAPGSVPTEFISLQSEWYDAIEAAALRALNDELAIDDLVSVINSETPVMDSVYAKRGRAENVTGTVVNVEFEEQSPLGTMPFFLDGCLQEMLSSYSVWSTRGSNFVEPCVFVTKGLPPIGGIAAMLDGRWSDWNWRQPYELKEGPPIQPPVNDGMVDDF